MTTAELAYETGIAEWRQEVDAQLRASWISLAGLFDLKPGPNSFGTHPSNDFVLPSGAAPAYVGSFNFQEGQVLLELLPGVTAYLNDAPAWPVNPLRSDAGGSPDLVTIADLTLFVIQRGVRTLVRLRDKNHPALWHFGGRRWFPIDEKLRIEATFVAYDPPKPLAITNILGDTSAQFSPGYVSFTLADQEQRLDVSSWREGGLVLHFRDETNGVLSYRGGRFLHTDPLVGDQVILDFNRAVSPPCAFTSYATCPLPPAQNRLTLSIEAGERRHDL